MIRTKRDLKAAADKGLLQWLGTFRELRRNLEIVYVGTDAQRIIRAIDGVVEFTEIDVLEELDGRGVAIPDEP